MINNITNRQKATARIESNGVTMSYGTCFLVLEDQIITARHVITNNIKSPLNINVYFEHIKQSFSVVEVIDDDIELDVALLRLDRIVKDVFPLTCAYFPLNRLDISTPSIHYHLLGYIHEVPNQQLPFWCFVNNINPNGVWDLNLSFIQNTHLYLSLEGLSGAPLTIKDKVFGITIEQVNNFAGIPAGVISIYKVRSFMERNQIICTRYENIDMLDQNDMKNELLDEAFNNINKKYVQSQDVKELITAGSKYVISKLRDLSLNDFTQLMNSISTSFNSNFNIRNFYTYINSLSEIVIQIVLIMYTYNSNVEFSFRKGASLKVNGGYYINYLFSEKYETYRNIIVKLFRYIIENPIVKIDDTSVVVIGNDHYFECDDRCNNVYGGASIDIDNIVNEISNPFIDREQKQELTNITNKFSNIKFHCKNCLKYDSCNSRNEIKNRIENALGGI